MAYKDKKKKLEYYRNYDANRRGDRRVYKQELYQKRKEYYQAWARKWYNEHKDIAKERSVRFRNSINGRYHHLQRSAKRRGLVLELTRDDFEKIVSLPCEYCGENIDKRGIDRVDSFIGYLKGNSVSCCKVCNFMKLQLSVDDFLDHIEKIYLFNNNEKNL